jgi:drug/metabolite transporter (DMT)-like permease
VETESLAHPRGRLIAAFGAIYFIWGSTYLAIAWAIQTIPPFLMAGSRFLLAGTALYLWATVSGAERPRPAQWAAAAVLGALFFLIGNGTVVWVEQSLASGLTALIIAMVSVWTALLEWLRPGGSRPSSMIIAGIVLGFLGVALLVVPGRVGGHPVDHRAVLMLMGSTFAWALASVSSRHANLPSSTVMAAGMEMLAGGLLLTIVGLATGELARFDPAAVTGRAVAAWLYLTLFGSIVAFTAFAWLLKVTSPNKVATAGYVNPMVAVLLGWLLGGESLSLRSLTASLIIVLGVVLIITGRQLSLTRLKPRWFSPRQVSAD